MIIAVCDPKGIAIEAIKTILYHDKGLSDRISRIYEFWNMEQLLDASRDSSFDCIVFPNYCNSHNSVVCSLSCGYNRFPLVEHDPRYTLIVRDILYWETARCYGVRQADTALLMNTIPKTEPLTKTEIHICH